MKNIIKGILLVVLLTVGWTVSAADDRFDVSTPEARKKFRDDPRTYWKIEENAKTHLCTWHYDPADIKNGEVVAVVPPLARKFYLAAYEKDTRYHDLCGTTKFVTPVRSLTPHRSLGG